MLAAGDLPPPSARHEVAVRRLAAWLAGHSEGVTRRLLPHGEALGEVLTQPGHLLDTACHAVCQELKQHGEGDITLMLARLRTR